jgi:hypothetical protein
MLEEKDLALTPEDKHTVHAFKAETPTAATLSNQIDKMIAGLEQRIRVLQSLKNTL